MTRQRELRFCNTMLSKSQPSLAAVRIRSGKLKMTKDCSFRYLWNNIIKNLGEILNYAELAGFNHVINRRNHVVERYIRKSKTIYLRHKPLVFYSCHFLFVCFQNYLVGGYITVLHWYWLYMRLSMESVCG